MSDDSQNPSSSSTPATAGSIGPDGATSSGNGTADAQQRKLGVKVNEADLKSQYANAFRSFTTTDEVLLDFGFNLVTMNRQPNPAAEAPAGLLQLDWQHRVVLNYRTAKNLAVELGKIITAYEKQFGEIKQPGQA